MGKRQAGFAIDREIGVRLRAERRRIGKNQTEMAAAGGVELNSQSAFETAKRLPSTEYLLRVESVGVDPAYVLTGSRTAGSASPLDLAFRNVPTDVQTTMRQLIEQLAALTAAPTPTLPPEDALAEMFEGLLMTIDRDADLAEQGLLLAQRLPIGLSQVRDLLPAEDHAGAPAPSPATGEDRATRRRVPTR